MSSKSKVKVSKFKKQRRVGIELPGLGKPGALAKRSYPPGHHGQARKRHTEYALRLIEKQKVLEIIQKLINIITKYYHGLPSSGSTRSKRMGNAQLWQRCSSSRRIVF